MVVLTDHTNLTFDTMDHASNQVLRQHLLLKEYGVEIQYIKGEQNVVADTLSCLPMRPATLKNSANADSFLNQAESFLNQRVFEDTVDFPLNLARMATKQRNCNKVQRLANKLVFLRRCAAHDRLVLVHRGNHIFVPVHIRDNLMVCYHDNLQHPGQSQMYSTINQFWWWKGLKQSEENHASHCEKCQKFKKTARGKYRHLLLRNNNFPEPFHTVSVDLVGPWSIQVTQALSGGH